MPHNSKIHGQWAVINHRILLWEVKNLFIIMQQITTKTNLQKMNALILESETVNNDSVLLYSFAALYSSFFWSCSQVILISVWQFRLLWIVACHWSHSDDNERLPPLSHWTIGLGIESGTKSFWMINCSLVSTFSRISLAMDRNSCVPFRISFRWNGRHCVREQRKR